MIIQVKPIVGGDLCQKIHSGYLLSGSLLCRMGGKEFVLKEGDAFYFGPGHDGLVIGEQPVVMIGYSNHDASICCKNNSNNKGFAVDKDYKFCK